MLDALFDVINIAEGVFVLICCEDYAGVIDNMCPEITATVQYNTKTFDILTKTTVATTGNVIAKVSRDLAVGVCPIPTCTFSII